jgi:hypothetical protein
MSCFWDNMKKKFGVNASQAGTAAPGTADASSPAAPATPGSKRAGVGKF